MSVLIKKTIRVLFILACLGSTISQAAAALTSQFTPPTHVTVHMYRLNADGSIWHPDNPEPCTNGSVVFGCTAFVGDTSHSYPYGSANPVTVPIETDYLLDVVPQELNPSLYHRTALEAQAIAARTYTYYHIYLGHSFDNSTNKQVFIPYKFESLPAATFPDNTNDPCSSSNLNARQQAVCNALASRYYVSYSDDSPAHTMFFADALNHTRTYPGVAYLVQVEDPVSGACDASDSGHRYGLSQKGASRWARGNQCSRTDSQPGGPWSVRWDRAEQILVHYYTGVHIRDASGSVLTPSLRWNPLSLDFHNPPYNTPPVMHQGQSYQITAFIQNTGFGNWIRDKPNQYYAFSYRWYDPRTDQTIDGNKAEIPLTVNKGTTTTVTLTLNDVPNWEQGAYRLQLVLCQV